MLVRFTSNKSGEIVMFAQDVRDLFQIIDKQCTQRGVFMKEQLPEAIARLHGAIDEEKLNEKLALMPVAGDTPTKFQMDRCTYKEITKDNLDLLRHAHPLLHFMELTQREGGFILWETEKDF